MHIQFGFAGAALLRLLVGAAPAPQAVERRIADVCTSSSGGETCSSLQPSGASNRKRAQQLQTNAAWYVHAARRAASTLTIDHVCQGPRANRAARQADHYGHRRPGAG